MQAAFFWHHRDNVFASVILFIEAEVFSRLIYSALLAQDNNRPTSVYLQKDKTTLPGNNLEK